MSSTTRMRHDPFPRSIRYLKQDSRAMQAYSDAKRSARNWGAQGMGDWAQAWERYADRVAAAGPSWSKIKVPSCVHSEGFYTVEGKVRHKRKPHRRSTLHSGIRISGGLQTSAELERRLAKFEEEREARRNFEGRLTAFAKEVSKKHKK